MRAVWGADMPVANFVASIIWNDDRGFDTNCRALGVQDKTGRLVGGVVYHNWEPHNGTIELSAGAITPRWLTRHIASQVLAYGFNTCGCQMLVARTSQKNERTRKLLRGLGFREQLIERLYGRSEHGILMTLTDTAWKAGAYHLIKDQDDGKAQGS